MLPYPTASVSAYPSVVLLLPFCVWLLLLLLLPNTPSSLHHHHHPLPPAQTLLRQLPWHRQRAAFFSRTFAAHTASAGDTAGAQPMSLFGERRTDLAKVVALVLDSMPSQPRYFLDNGTLLGLWRDGRLIESDVRVTAWTPPRTIARCTP
jgi:hypothetical protein